MPSSIAVTTLLFALYPLLIFAGLHYLDPRTLGVIVVLALLLRHRSAAARLVSGVSARHWAVLALPFALGAGVVATNSEALLLLYPAVMNAAMLIVFGITLLRPPTIIERLARAQDPELSPRGVRYTRGVTAIWCVFFIANGTIAAFTALFASRETWAIYNGLVAYALMGALFGGERLVRERWLQRAD